MNAIVNNAIVWPDKHGTSPMAHDGSNAKTVAEGRKEDWSPVSKHQIQPGCGKWVNLRGTGQLNLTRETKLSDTNGERENPIFSLQLKVA